MEADERLARIVSKLFKKNPADITLDSDMDSIEGWDSLSHLNLIMTLEKEFKVQFHTDQIILLNSVGKIQQALQQKGVL